jgi:hypothetical protein
MALNILGMFVQCLFMPHIYHCSICFIPFYILLFLFYVDKVLLKMATRMKMKTMMISMILLSVIQTGTARSWSWLPGSQDNETADIQVCFTVKNS